MCLHTCGRRLTTGLCTQDTQGLFEARQLQESISREADLAEAGVYELGTG